MKTYTCLLIFLLGFPLISTAQEYNYATNHVLAALSEAHAPSLKAILESNNLPEVSNLEIFSITPALSYRSKAEETIRFLKITFSWADGSRIPAAIEQLQATQLFDWVEPNFKGRIGGEKLGSFFPNDTHFDRQWGLYNDGTLTFNNLTFVADADIDMECAWDITTGNSNGIIAILDSGVKIDHPELIGRIWTNSFEVPGNNQDDDNNGLIDDINGWDFVNEDNNPADDNGHGTNVCGIATATGNNSLGYAGVDWQCEIMALKMQNMDGWGFYSDWADALYYATDNGADVINMSVGGDSPSSLLQNAVSYASQNGSIVVASMMNFDNEVAYYPAAYSNTIAVGSTNPDDSRTSPFTWDPASGSNYGSHIDLVAPGNVIYGLNYLSNTNYLTYWGGTSQAAPLVAGVISLLKGMAPNLDVNQARQLLTDNAEDQVGPSNEDPAGWDKYFGYGRLNACNTLNALIVSVPEIEFDDLSLSIYPNPSHAKAPWSLSWESHLESCTISVLDSKGALVFQQKEVSGKGTKMPGLEQAGLHVVQITVNQQVIARQKFVVH